MDHFLEFLRSEIVELYRKDRDSNPYDTKTYVKATETLTQYQYLLKVVSNLPEEDQKYVKDSAREEIKAIYN